MTARMLISSAALMLGALAGGCANDGSGNLLATSSVGAEKTATAAKVDPVCVALASQIDTLRKEGTVDRLEKAATGKSENVQVKRASLAKQSELNKANADFQTKCGPQLPKAQTAQVTPAVTPATAAAGGKTAPAAVAPVAPKN